MSENEAENKVERESSQEKRDRQDKEKEEARQARRERLGHESATRSESQSDQPQQQNDLEAAKPDAQPT